MPFARRAPPPAGRIVVTPTKEVSLMVIPTHPRPFTLGSTSEGDPVQALRSRLTGELVTADSPHYDRVRKVQEITVDRRPLAIVRAASAGDVAVAVRFARER